MRTSDSPYVVDWFVVSLRWLVILGLVASLAAGGEMLAWPNLLLAWLAIWNVALAAIAGTNRRLNHHREISVAVDSVVAVIYFLLMGGIASPSCWVLVLPIFSATLYFDWNGTKVATLAVVAVEIAYTLLSSFTVAALISGLAIAGALLLAGAVFGFASRSLLREVHRERMKQIEVRELAQKAESDRLRSINERVRAIYELTSMLTGTLNYQRVLETALDVSLTALSTEPESGPDDQLVAAVLLFSGEELMVGSARRFTSADLRTQFPGREGLLAQAIGEGEPVLSDDASNDPELAKIIALRNCRSIYCFPLRSGFNIYGVMLFAHPEPSYFTSERRDVMDILGRQLMIAIQNARLYQDLAEEKERMMEVQEEARKKLARDLHDGPTQSVVAIAMRVNLAKRMVERDTPAALAELTKIEDLARRTTKEIRHMLFTLRPLVLESRGLVAALETIAEKTRETYSQEVIVKVDEKLLEDLEIGKQGVIFFIAEEAVNNARKHAQAPHIYVSLQILDKDISLLEIRDDGLGFDVEAVNRAYDRRGSLGMVNLRERAELVNGVLHIESAPGKGTKVQVYLPMTEDGADRLHRAQATP
jgi:signal transduction histidine kinase